ncbi:MAG TPA: methyl-accepting chemotaxis protein [Allocoleopsis sp.]
MFKRITLQTWLFGAFFFMGLLVLSIALVGWSGNHSLSKNINNISEQQFPSLLSLWKIKQLQTEIIAEERWLINPRITPEIRLNAKTNIAKKWDEVNQTFQEYEKYLKQESDHQEEKLYNQYLTDWEKYKQASNEFMRMYKEYDQTGIYNPRKLMTELVAKGLGTSPEMLKLQKIDDMIENINNYTFTQKRPAFYKSQTSLIELIKFHENNLKESKNIANKDITKSKFWITLGMIIGPITSIIFGLYFIFIIAQPLTLQLQKSGIQLTTSSTQISASGKQLEATVTEQLASTNQVIATTKEIAKTSSELLKTMSEVSTMSIQTSQSANSRQKDLFKMENTMKQLAEATQTISAKLGVISEKAHNINTIVMTITKVADQTNLLSLNAAIEAEKAGEYGIGFAVVAREIRRLADQTALATLDIDNMVKQMQSSVSAGVMEMDKFSREVIKGVEDVQNISMQTTEIIEQVQSLNPRFQLVSEGMEAQSQSANQISEAMIQLGEASSQTAASLREINRAIEQLNEAAYGLQKATLTLK